MPRPQLPMNREPLLWPSGVSRNPPPSGGGGCQTALSKITDIVLPHEVGIQKSSRENTLRFDFSAPRKYSSARIVLIRRLARNWPEDQTFKAILMGSIDSVLIPSA